MKAELVVMDAPWEEPVAEAEATLKGAGYRVASGPIHTSFYGDAISRTMRLLLAWKGDTDWGDRILEGLGEARRRNPVGVSGCLLPLEAVDEGLVVAKEEGTRSWNHIPIRDQYPETDPPRIWATGTLTDPHGERYHFYDPTGPVAGRPRPNPHPPPNPSPIIFRFGVRSFIPQSCQGRLGKAAPAFAHWNCIFNTLSLSLSLSSN